MNIIIGFKLDPDSDTNIVEREINDFSGDWQELGNILVNFFNDEQTALEVAHVIRIHFMELFQSTWAPGWESPSQKFKSTAFESTHPTSDQETIYREPENATWQELTAPYEGTNNKKNSYDRQVYQESKNNSYSRQTYQEPEDNSYDRQVYQGSEENSMRTKVKSTFKADFSSCIGGYYEFYGEDGGYLGRSTSYDPPSLNTGGDSNSFTAWIHAHIELYDSYVICKFKRTNGTASHIFNYIRFANPKVIDKTLK